jgi:hypothetical protein
MRRPFAGGTLAKIHSRSFAMPIENMIVLGIVLVGAAAFSAVAGWLTWESGKQRKIDRLPAAAE